MTQEEKPARLHWVRALVLWVVVAASLCLAAGVGGAVWISRTAAGRDLALEWALTRARPAINGSITVGSAATGGLLGGATLYDVRLTDGAGHRVLAVDSIRARYSVAGLLGGPPAIADLALWGPVVDLAPAAGGRVDLGGLLMSREAAPDGHTPAFRVRGLRVRGGSVIVRADDGAPKRVEGVEGDFPRVDLRPGPDVFLTADADRVALSYPMGAGALELSDIAGTVRIGSDGISVDASRFRLPASEGSGRLEARPDGGELRTVFDLDMTRLALPDLIAIDGRLDRGTAHGRVRIADEAGRPTIEFEGMTADFGAGGRITLNGRLLRGDTTELAGLRAEPERLAARELDRFLPEPLPVAGLFSGDLLFDGAEGRLAMAGELALLAASGVDTLVHLAGGGTIRGFAEVSDIAVAATSLDYALLERFVPEAEWRGRGDMTIRADGALETGMDVEVSANHHMPGGPSSAVAFTGSLYGDTAVSVVDLDGTLSPLALRAIGPLFPNLRLTGAVEGSFSLRGAMDRLDVTVDLDTDAGPIAAEGTIDARDPAGGYRVAASSDGLHLSRLIARLPDSTVVAGRATLSGRGLDLESLRGNLTLDAGSSTIGALPVDSIELNAWVDDDGLLHVEAMHLEAGGVTLHGDGSIGAAPGVRGDGVALAVSSPSIHRLRGLVMGPNLVAWDELPPAEQELLIEVDGVDPDTLPRARDIRFDGTVGGRILVDGGLDDPSAAATMTFGGLQYGHASARSLTLDIEATRAAVRATVTGDSLTLRDREFRRATLEGDVDLGDRGRLRTLIQRSERESYEAQAVVRLGERSGRVDLDRLTLVLDDRRWNLQGPARFEWDPDAFEVRDFGLIRPGGGGLSLAADGRLARGRGESDFSLRAAELDLAVVGGLLQMDTPPIGTLAAALDAAGSGDDPEWRASVRVDGALYGTLSFDSLTARGSSAGRTLDVRIESWMNDRRTLRVAGTAPLDLRPVAVEERIPDRPVDLAIAADSFPARMVLGVLQSLEEVGGAVSGEVALGGRPSNLEPDGELRLDDASALMAPLGVRLSSVELDMDLSRSGVVTLAGSAVSGGTMGVRGTVDLGQLGDSIPLSLTFSPRDFQVVDRADMEAAITSESVTLTGSYDFPFIEGTVDVEGGTVFLEEFQRTAEVVDLYDPALFSAATVRIASEGDAEGVGERIPFLQNLRVLINMRVGRGNFLRSRQMNVETTGELGLTFDRRGNQLILEGQMEVARGTYSVGPRTLTLTEGLFRFPGTPGFNPGIAITAEDRLRTREGQPLVITADISGTLLSPFLRLSSDAESAMSETDLVNYLFLGRPTSALMGEAGAPVEAGWDLFLGQVANEIGYRVATGLGVDHVSVSQSEQGQASAAFGASSLQVELGKYILDDVFLTGVFQRGFCTDPTLPRNSGGVRLEVGMPRDVRLEGFLEGRCTRERYRGLGDASLELENIWGFLLFREWGY